MAPGMHAIDRHELVLAPHRLGGQAAAVQSLRERSAARPGTLLGAWTSEYGPLNRVVSLWSEAADAPEGADSDDWLATEPVRKMLRVRRAFVAVATSAPLAELRQYALQPGAGERFVAALLAALPYRERYSPCAGLWTTRERGRDVAVHLWPYASFDERLAARERAQRDPRWNDYRVTIRPLVAAMQAALLTPLPR